MNYNMRCKAGPGRFISRVMAIGLLAGLATQPSCSAERDPASLFGPAEDAAVVVDAVLYVGRPLPEIFVTRTRAAHIASVDEAGPVNDAEVIVTQGLAKYTYRPDVRPGRYLPPPDAPRVRPETEYRLLVRALGREVRGATVTPKRISLDEVAIVDETTLAVRNRFEPDFSQRNQVAYGEGLIEVRFEPVGTEAYQVVVLDMESNEEGSSPPLEARDGRLLLPWFAFGSSGAHQVEIYALDRNLFDFLRSFEASGEMSFGFGSLAGDTFERPVFNLDGGIGVFGSASVDTFGFVVLSSNRSG